MGLIIGLVNQKGGTAKTTTSVALAYWLQDKKKKKVLVVDADNQMSSSLWLKGMNALTIPYKVIQTADDILEQIPELANDYEYVVVDGAANISETTRAILFRLDLALIPVQPTGVDLRSTKEIIRLVNQAQSVRGGLPNAHLFLSRAVKNTRLKDEAVELLSQITSAKLLNTVIHQRQIIADSSGQCETVFSLPGRSAKEAAMEYTDLFEEVI